MRARTVISLCRKGGSIVKRTALLTAVFAAVVCGVAWCQAWHISPDGTGDVADIRTGISLASNGDTLLLADGVYTGSGNTNLSYAGKAIVIRSESGDPHACVIDCEGGGGRWARGFEFYRGEGPEAVLEGITIRNGYMYEGGAIWCWMASPTITNVILLDNIATFSSGGIFCGGASPVITNVTLCGNSAPEGGAIYCTDASSPVISKTIMAFNSDGGALRASDVSNDPQLSCCDIFGNTGGDWGVSILSQHGVSGNISANPLFCFDANPEQPYAVSNTSPCVNQPGCSIMGAAGVGCADGIEATVDIDPDTINPRHRRRWLTCYIELPEGYEPDSIDVATVMINDVVPAESNPTEVADYDDDGIADLMVKFSWPQVYNSFSGYGQIEMRVSGQVSGTVFAGADTVRVLFKEVKMPRNFDDETARLMPEVAITTWGSGDDGVIIKLGLPVASDVRVAIYDVQGRLVRELVNETRPAASHSIVWDARDSRAARVAPGVYFIDLETDLHSEINKIVLVR
jgi:predicted outer membrane repeat protein